MNSCILALGQNQPVSTATLTFNGAPNVALTYCTIRSNTSLNCNGHDFGCEGLTGGRNRIGLRQPVVEPAGRAGHLCGARGQHLEEVHSRPGVTLISNSFPSTSAVITVPNPTYLEYHVCGDLTLSGSWSLGTAAQDTVVVIENGSLIMGDNASIQAARVTFVLTGDNSKASRIQFPGSNGHAATLTLSPSTGSSNPWHGISIYQDPALTNTSEDWGSGTTINVDGLVYLPNADVTLQGNPSSNSPICTKVVVNTLTSNGSVNLGQTLQGCSSLGVQQWGGPLRLSQ